MKLPNLEELKKELEGNNFKNPTNTDALLWGMWKDLSGSLSRIDSKLSWVLGFSAGLGGNATGLLIAIAVAVF
jgi:hypothetical protein